jgi:hypothetical protein
MTVGDYKNSASWASRIIGKARVQHGFVTGTEELDTVSTSDAV